jgi:hypothetical protein
VSNLPEIIEKAQEKGTFSVLDVAKGRGYPQDIVDIYMDQDSARRVVQLEKQIADTTDPDDVNDLDHARAALVEKVKGSRLTFHMRGLPPGVVEGFRKSVRRAIKASEGTDLAEEFEEAFSEKFGAEVMAAMIVKVYDANDNVDEHKWTADEFLNFAALAPNESLRKLVELRHELTFAAAYFDQAVDANF